jgi:hypothetical protein
MGRCLHSMWFTIVIEIDHSAASGLGSMGQEDLSCETSLMGVRS